MKNRLSFIALSFVVAFYSRSLLAQETKLIMNQNVACYGYFDTPDFSVSFFLTTELQKVDVINPLAQNQPGFRLNLHKTLSGLQDIARGMRFFCRGTADPSKTTLTAPEHFIGYQSPKKNR